jgi:hypothetical protein
MPDIKRFPAPAVVDAEQLPLATANTQGAIASNLTTALTPAGDSRYVSAAQLLSVAELSVDMVTPTAAIAASGPLPRLDYTIAIPASKGATIEGSIISASTPGIGWNLRVNGSVPNVYGGSVVCNTSGTVAGNGYNNAAISMGLTLNQSTLLFRLYIGPQRGASRLCTWFAEDVPMFKIVQGTFVLAIGAITSVGIEPAGGGNNVVDGSAISGNLSNFTGWSISG